MRDAETVREVVADADAVVHQAAQAGVRTSVAEPRKVTDINVDGTVTLLEAAKEADVERVILASSSSVYGKPELLPYAEEHPTEPVSPYGVTKLAQEHMARVYTELHGLLTVALRYFTVYGPRMRPNMAISNFVSWCPRERSERGPGSARASDVSTGSRPLFTGTASRRETSRTWLTWWTRTGRC